MFFPLKNKHEQNFLFPRISQWKIWKRFLSKVFLIHFQKIKSGKSGTILRENIFLSTYKCQALRWQTVIWCIALILTALFILVRPTLRELPEVVTVAGTVLYASEAMHASVRAWDWSCLSLNFVMLEGWF